MPAGFGAGGMPVGLQLVGNYFAEGTLLHAAHAFQRRDRLAPARTPAGVPTMNGSPATLIAASRS